MTIKKDFEDSKGNYDILKKHVKDRKLHTIIDIGAWWGPWTLYWQPYANRIEVFEPNIKMLPLLENNISNFKNCVLHKTALGSKKCKVSRGYESHSGTNHVTDFDGDVDVNTLDSYNFSDVDVIKIDVEGFEIEVLKGAEKTIKSCKPLIQIEGNSSGKRYGVSKKDMAELLASWGMTRIEKKWPDQVWTF